MGIERDGEQGWGMEDKERDGRGKGGKKELEEERRSNILPNL